MTVREKFKSEFELHVTTWAPHCGAPKGVYIGHLDKLLKAAREDEREACAKIAADEGASWIVDAIRARGEKP